MTTLSIITATRNSAATIAGCLASAQSQTIPVEHIIIDGVSSDETLNIISRLNPDAQRLTDSKRLIPQVLVHMRTGGASNASLAARIRANRMDRRAWETNGLKPYPWTLLCKPLRKLPQWWRRP